MTREEKINALIEHELDTFTVGFFEEILRYGCKGFDELTDEEIDFEYKFIFEEDEKKYYIYKTGD
jgi:hypothetical protein